MTVLHDFGKFFQIVPWRTGKFKDENSKASLWRYIEAIKLGCILKKLLNMKYLIRRKLYQDFNTKKLYLIPVTSV